MVLILKNLLFTVLVPGTVAGYLPLFIARDSVSSTGLQLALASAVLGLGGAIYLWCLYDFASFGRGTPAPIDAPVRLVIRGLYRYSRNPMYVGVLTTILGWSIYFGEAWLLGYLAAVWSLFQAFVVLYEEPHLRTLFGEEYRSYCDRVGRWIPM